jgi:hypothetical protein
MRLRLFAIAKWNPSADKRRFAQAKTTLFYHFPVQGVVLLAAHIPSVMQAGTVSMAAIAYL